MLLEESPIILYCWEFGACLKCCASNPWSLHESSGWIGPAVTLVEPSSFHFMANAALLGAVVRAPAFSVCSDIECFF